LRSCFRLPGRSPTQAREAFLAPLRLALNCVTRAQMYLSPASPGEPESLRLSQDPLLLSSSVVEGGLRLRLRHQFRVVEEDGGRAQPWHVSTQAYAYRVDRTDGESELLSWHWHPIPARGVQYPHLHVSGAPHVPGAAHLPTSRVSIEAVLRLLLTDYGVPPRRSDFASVLDAAERPFLQYRRWSSLPDVPWP